MSIVINFELIKEEITEYPFISMKSYVCGLNSYPNVLNHVNNVIKLNNCLFFFIRDDNYEQLSSIYSEKIHKKTYFDPFFYGIKKGLNYKEENVNCAWVIYLDYDYKKTYLSVEFYDKARKLIEELNNFLFTSQSCIDDKIIKELESLDFSTKISYCPPLLKSDPIKYHIEAEKTIIKWLKNKNKTYSILDKTFPARFYIE